MRGRSCTQPFLVEGGTCRPDAFLLLPCWVSRSPPHPPQCAHWGTFPPRGRLWGCATLPVYETTPPSPPSRWAGRYGRRKMGRRPGRKKREPTRVPPTRKGGSREEEPLPPWCSFLRLSSKESRAPPPESAGPPGRCAPRVASAPPTWRVPPPAPQKISLQTSIFNSIIKSR